MLSRVAETLYWTARYIERAENMARLINVNNLLLMDLPKGVSPGWEPLIDIIGAREAFLKLYPNFSEDNVVRYLALDERNPSSILNSINQARANARTVREVMPRDAWHAINSLNIFINEEATVGVSKRNRTQILTHIIASSRLIFGTLDGVINHDQGYTFIRFGALLERADMTTRILDVRSASLIQDDTAPFENIQWMSVLSSLSAYQMYRQQMGVRVRAESVLEFMFHSETFPRAFRFCLNKLIEFADRLPHSTAITAAIERGLATAAKANDMAALKGDALCEFIDELQIELAAIHTALADEYFLRNA